MYDFNDFADMRSVAKKFKLSLERDVKKDSKLVALWKGKYCQMVGTREEIGDFLVGKLILNGVPKARLEMVLARRNNLAIQVNELDLPWN